MTKISDTSFYLDFAMAAPGPDNIAFYDPAAGSVGFFKCRFYGGL